MNEFECIVVGGGHAGCEAAGALGRLGHRILLITGNIDRLGYLSCNPAIGGLAKGHMVREIDALGGMMGRWADAAGIQFRTLNASKGPAVRATRAQMDRPAYQAAVRKSLFAVGTLRIWQDNVCELLESNGRLRGVKTALGEEFFAPHVLLCTGTFLEGVMHVGLRQLPGGRMGDARSTGVSASLERLGISMGRLKTGTTPRILASSIDFSSLEEQQGDAECPQFSFYGAAPAMPQTSCHITWTNSRTHEIIKAGFDRSPLFTGVIQGTGARYCPSIEDKVARFPQRERHQIFLEPEGLGSGEVYANGISTSLPLDVQKDLVNSIRGLERAVLTRPGYAIEYDYANPIQLWPTLESKKIPGLWCAGQLNGTSGYEEAAAQGLWAALNIAACLEEREPFLPGRDTAYMAVLVDDLVTLGTEEPYRMFTSRAEHRLLLREDNADERLSPMGHERGLLSTQDWQKFCEKNTRCRELKDALGCSALPGHGASLADWLRRPESSLDNISLDSLPQCVSQALQACLPAWRRQVESDIKYSGYIRRQQALADKGAQREGTGLPLNLDYAKISGLSSEVVEKLSRVRPLTLGQASRISGVTPAAIACLEIHLKKLALSTRAKLSIRSSQ